MDGIPTVCRVLKTTLNFHLVADGGVETLGARSHPDRSGVESEVVGFAWFTYFLVLQSFNGIFLQHHWSSLTDILQGMQVKLEHETFVYNKIKL